MGAVDIANMLVALMLTPRAYMAWCIERYGNAFVLASDDPDGDEGPDGMTIRDPEDINTRWEEPDIGPRGEALARKQMAEAARVTDSGSDSKGLPDMSANCAGPVVVEWRYTKHLVTRQEYWAARRAGIPTPWWTFDCNICDGKYEDTPEGARLARFPELKAALGITAKCNKCGDLLPRNRDVLADVLVVSSYQGNDGRARCPQQGCEAVLDDSGHCPDCGHSTIWTEEHRSHTEGDGSCTGQMKDIGILEAKVAKALITGVQDEQAERHRKLRFWFGAAPPERIKADRAEWWRTKVVPYRQLADKTGLWHHQYMTKAMCNDIWELCDERLAGLPPVGCGKAEYEEPKDKGAPDRLAKFPNLKAMLIAERNEELRSSPEPEPVTITGSAVQAELERQARQWGNGTPCWVKDDEGNSVINNKLKAHAMRQLREWLAAQGG